VEAARHVLGEVAAGRPVPWSAVEVLLGAVLGHELVALARSVERGGEYRVMRAVELAGAIAALAAGVGADDQAGGDR